MNKTILTTAIAFAAIAPVHAQGTLRYTIQTESSVTTENTTLIDGEERRGRGGFGGGGAPVVRKSKIVFDEGKHGDGTVRKYHKAEAVVTSEGSDGETNDSTVKSAFAGKQVLFTKDAAFENDKNGTKFSAQALRGIPKSVNVANLVPEGSLTQGAEVELGEGLRDAVRSLVHPVRAQRRGRGDAGNPGNGRRRRGGDADGEGGERRRRRGGEEGEGGNRRRRGGGEEGGGEGGNRRRRRGGEEGGGERRRRGGEEGGGERRRRGGEEGGGERQRRGNRGEGDGDNRRGRRNRRGFGRVSAEDSALNLLANSKLEWNDLTGKVTSVEGNLATIEFTGTAKGEGTPAEFGDNMARFGGRRGFGGRGRNSGNDDTPGEASGSINLNGSMIVDVNTRQMKSLHLSGKVKSMSDTVFTFSRGGEDMEIERHRETSGKFKVTVTCDKTPVDTDQDK